MRRTHNGKKEREKSLQARKKENRYRKGRFRKQVHIGRAKCKTFKQGKRKYGILNTDLSEIVVFKLLQFVLV